jgi:DNA-binding transcriptional MerR regulator
LGRSESNYRLLGEDALRCVQVVQGRRSLGLTLKETQDIVTQYVECPGEAIEALLDRRLAQAAARGDARITDLLALH